jgi:hypothetical protein
MTDNITNKDYITITDSKVMVCGVPTTTYRGQEIWWLKDLSNDFKKIQQIVQREYGAAPIAMRVMSSETNGKYAKIGNPSPKHGKNAWVNFVFANGIETRWVFYASSRSSASDCADRCAGYCGYHVRTDPGFRSGVFGSVADKIKQKATQTESPKVGQLIEMDFGNCMMQLKIVSIQNKAK